MVEIKLNIPTPTNITWRLKNNLSKLNLKKILVAMMLLAIGATGGYYWQGKPAKNHSETDAGELSQLQSQVAKLQKDVADIQKATATTPAATPAAMPAATGVAPSADILTSISAGITSGNAAVLEGYMASAVQVDTAAAASLGSRTPAQAVGDVVFLKTGTAPWNFALAADVIAKYQTGTYKQYFPSTAYVGKSANGYVVSFQFDSSSKISGIFMSGPNVL